MQVNNKIKPLLPQSRNDFPRIILKVVPDRDVWIMIYYFSVRSLREVMNLGSRNLLFNATNYRRSKNDISDRAEPDNQNFHVRKLGNYIFSLERVVQL